MTENFARNHPGGKGRFYVKGTAAAPRSRSRSPDGIPAGVRDTARRVSANLDLVRSIYAKWERGEFGVADWADPEIEYVIVDGPEPETWTGLAAMAEGMREFLRPFEGLRMVVDEYRELDAERVLVLVHLGGRGKISGVDLDQITSSGMCADLFQIRDGRVARLVVYYDSDRALADLGLEE